MSMATGTSQISLEALRKTVSLGREPDFKEAVSSDQLLEMVLALAAEVSVLRDRLDTHERVAQTGDLPTLERVEDYTLSPEVFEARSGFRQRLLDKIFRPVRQAAARDILSKHDAQSAAAKHAAE